jgi:hypothetical protein
MKQEAVKRINEELIQKTGVDFSRYRNDELMDTIANAVTFPLFFARSVFRPIGLMLLAVILAIAFADSGYFKAFLGFPGFVLAIANGMLLGLVLFIHRVRDDMTRVFEISSDISLQVARDISAAKANLVDGPASFPSLLEIFQGVNAIIILPMVIQVMDRKIPLFGGLAARIAERFFDVVDARLSSVIKSRDDEGGGPVTAASPEEVSAWLGVVEQMVSYTRGGITQVVDKVSRVVAFPFTTVFIIVFLMTLAIFYAGYSLLG